MDHFKKKVCHFSSVHHVWDTRVFYRECVSLAKIYEVTLIAIGDENTFKNGVKIIGVPKPTNFFVRFFYTVFKVFILAVKEDANIYHIHDAEMVPFGIALSLLGKKVIYDIHENTHDDILLKPWVNKNIRLVLAKLYNLLLFVGSKFMHYIVVVADPIFLPKFFVKEKDCTIIQNFADPEDLENHIQLNRSDLPGNHLFYVGMIRDMYYNIDPVLEAIYLLKQKGIQTHLHLIGYFGSKTNHHFNHLTFWDEISESVTYYGFMEMKEAYKISEICKIGLCIKNQPESMLVSHERKLFEYMCVGLPSIFCNSHIYNQVNNQYHIGVGVNLLEPADLADAIASLLLDMKSLNAFAKNNLNAAHSYFNWGKEETKLYSLYSHLLNC